MKEYLEKQRQLEAEMCFRHPRFNVMYNYLVAVCIVALFASFIWWGIDIHTRKKAEAMTAQLLAQMDMEHHDRGSKGDCQSFLWHQEL